MCFSAGASFTAGALLAVAGAETIRKVHKPSQAAFAAIPLFFAFQQCTEGVLWLTLGRGTHPGLQAVSTYIFLIMAQVIWPIMIPLSVFLMEEDETRKRVLSRLLAVGVAVGLIYLYRLIHDGSHVQIIGSHIVYYDTAPDLSGIVPVIVYLVATIAPLFVSSVKRVHFLGTIMAVSFIVSAIFYVRCLTSVWCFFAALMSFVVLFIVREERKRFINIAGLKV